MNGPNKFTAEDVARIMQSAGYNVTKRTINYYAFDKKMFKPTGSGKKAFTANDMDKIQAILLLREKENLNLKEISRIVNREDFSFDDLKLRFPKIDKGYYSFATYGLKESYALELYDGHIILLMDSKKVLFGTGATTSIGEKSLNLLGREYGVAKTFLETDIKELSSLLGYELDAMMGGDILKEVHLTVDIDARKAYFSKAPQDQKDWPMPVELVMNVPIVTVMLGNRKLRMFIDTGAKVSYLRDNIIKPYYELAPDLDTDYYPGFRRYEVETRKIQVKVAGHNLELRFASIDHIQHLDTVLLMAGCDGIIGQEIFKHFNPIYFNLPGQLISFNKRALPLY